MAKLNLTLELNKQFICMLIVFTKSELIYGAVFWSFFFVLVLFN